MATQNRKSAVLHADGSWCYLVPNSITECGMIVDAETPAWSIINFVGMKAAGVFMEEYFQPRQYLHRFHYTFEVITPLDDARDVPQIEIHKAMLDKIDSADFESMKAKISHSTSEKLL